MELLIIIHLLTYFVGLTLLKLAPTILKQSLTSKIPKALNLTRARDVPSTEAVRAGSWSLIVFMEHLTEAVKIVGLEDVDLRHLASPLLRTKTLLVGLGMSVV